MSKFWEKDQVLELMLMYAKKKKPIGRENSTVIVVAKDNAKTEAGFGSLSTAVLL